MSIKFIILGCGSSMGVPRPDGFFGDCDSKNKKNYRTRCSALINFHNQNILIDTSPDLRQQLLSNNIQTIDAVLYSHLHADQTHGINDLRVFYLKNKKKTPVYADDKTKNFLLSTFKYCFNDTYGYPAILEFKKFKRNFSFKNKNKKISFVSVPVQHGKINSLCYIINKKLAYASDTNLIYHKDLKLFKKLDFLIIDCLWYKYHPAHYNLDKILNLVNTIKPKKTILTNMHTDLDYNKLKKKLPKNIVPGYDGMTLKL
jgi:phosphoribosyl 1,2-cyclic phosphate phosphodiesterase|tara:strand:+ start:974 stop:1747 length:774 start_codon:yes stop_codon:yes gene_type:complete